MKKIKDYRETIGNYQINMKQGVEKFALDVAKYYQLMFPARADYFKRMLKQLKEVSTDGYQAGRSGKIYCSIRVPTELMMFMQRWIPEFGKDSADLELLAKVWCDLLPVKDHRKRTRLVVKEDYDYTPPQADQDATEDEEDSSEEEECCCNCHTTGETGAPCFLCSGRNASECHNDSQGLRRGPRKVPEVAS